MSNKQTIEISHKPYYGSHFKSSKGRNTSVLDWKYWLTNPLLFFITYRIAVPDSNQDIEVMLKE